MRLHFLFSRHISFPPQAYTALISKLKTSLRLCVCMYVCMYVSISHLRDIAVLATKVIHADVLLSLYIYVCMHACEYIAPALE